ncbi:S8 family serine peptidase [candidate division KSB1 bacterium]
MKSKALLIFFLLLVVNAPAAAQPGAAKYWVFFADKDAGLLQRAVHQPEYRSMLLSERSLKRRSRISGADLIQYSDLPVSRDYTAAVSSIAGKKGVVSRWLNAVVFRLTPAQIDAVRSLPFVMGVRRVGTLTAPRPQRDPEKFPGDLSLIKTSRTQLDYGGSFEQNDMLNITALHQAQITGSGILIGVIDDGFDLDHEAFAGLEVVVKYDFINGDTTTAYQSGQDLALKQGAHGTSVLSVIGGFSEGSLIGSAYGSTFALAKTEDVSSETPIEEDFWVAAIEWMDSIGVDIVTSSLGYTTFDDPGDSYEKEEMDGNTALVTIAADMAVGKGIVVVTSAGNEGNNSWGIVNAPADGDSVIAVGAVDYNGVIASFSSRGPTADGRYKPDIVAPGVGIYTATVNGGGSSYITKSGTSFACPLTASVAALVLSVHPELTPMDVMSALKRTADRAFNPNNTYGWGLIDAFAAAIYFGPAFSNTPEVETTAEGYVVSTHVLSGRWIDDSEVWVMYRIGESQTVYTENLTRVDETSEYSVMLPLQEPGVPVYFYFSARDKHGQTTVFPNQTLGPHFVYTAGQAGIQHPGNRDRDRTRTIPDKLTLAGNYPNPFNHSTIIAFDLSESTDVTLTIYDISGRRIKILHSGTLPAGTYSMIWDGTTSDGTGVSSGVYFYRFVSPGFSAVKKMVYVK